MKHRIIILASFTLLVLAAIGFGNPRLFPGPILALLGILVVVSCLISPIVVYYSIKDLSSIDSNKSTIIHAGLSIVYLFLVIFGVYKIWPQLMSV